MLMLLDRILSNTPHNRPANSPQNPVVRLVTRKSASKAPGNGTAESTFAFLGFAGCALVV